MKCKFQNRTQRKNLLSGCQDVLSEQPGSPRSDVKFSIRDVSETAFSLNDFKSVADGLPSRSHQSSSSRQSYSQRSSILSARDRFLFLRDVDPTLDRQMASCINVLSRRLHGQTHDNFHRQRSFGSLCIGLGDGCRRHNDFSLLGMVRFGWTRITGLSIRPAPE